MLPKAVGQWKLKFIQVVLANDTFSIYLVNLGTGKGWILHVSQHNRFGMSELKVSYSFH